MIKNILLAAAVAFVLTANYCKFKQSMGWSTDGCTRSLVDVRGCDDEFEWKGKRRKEAEI